MRFLFRASNRLFTLVGKHKMSCLAATFDHTCLGAHCRNTITAALHHCRTPSLPVEWTVSSLRHRSLHPSDAQVSQPRASVAPCHPTPARLFCSPSLCSLSCSGMSPPRPNYSTIKVGPFNAHFKSSQALIFDLSYLTELSLQFQNILSNARHDANIFFRETFPRSDATSEFLFSLRNKLNQGRVYYHRPQSRVVLSLIELQKNSKIPVVQKNITLPVHFHRKSSSG